tara:strand:+ start:10354 stop:10815 length:462 start_codon:yes stop_codon:yes gene_type:complete
MSENQRLKDALDYLKSIGEINAWIDIGDKISADKNRIAYLTKEDGGILKGKETAILKISYPDINWDWVTSGLGEMLTEDNNMVREGEAEYSLREQKIFKILAGTSQLPEGEQLSMLREEFMKLQGERNKLADKISGVIDQLDNTSFWDMLKGK